MDGFGTAPPWRPEWRSAPAPVTTRSSPTSPRAATVSDGSLGRHMAPSAETTRSAASRSRCSAQEAGEAGAADLLLSLEEEADVERKLAALGEEGLRHQDRDQQRALVVGGAARVDPPVAHARLERRASATRLVVSGGLDVVVAVDEDRRSARPAQPLADDDGLAVRLDDLAGRETEPPGEPVRRPPHVVRVGGLPADARDAQELGELAQVALARRQKMAWPPSIERTWPVIHPASSAAKKSTPRAMSSGVPSRRVAIRSSSARCPSSP